MKNMRVALRWTLAAVMTVAVSAGAMAVKELPANDYPTAARADYVFACMQVNGQTRETLEKCSCSVDRIAAIIPWSAYEEAETIISVGMAGGEKTAWTMNPMIKKKVDDLKRAQVEGELFCF